MITLNPETQLGSLITNEFGDSYLFAVNRNNFSDIDYKTKFNHEFQESFNKENTLFIITGTDSGLMVKQLLETPLQNNSTYIFIDFPEIIQLTKNQYILNNSQVIVTTQENWEEEGQNLGLETYFSNKKVEHIKSFAAQNYYLEEYFLLRQAIEEEINHLRWKLDFSDTRTFIKAQIENLAENHSPAIVLKDYFKGKSALILAGGPSLDEHIEWIEKNQGYYVVIAVARIARRLLETKIKPDIFVSIDPLPANFDVSKEIFNFEQTAILVNLNYLSPLLLGNWLGINLYLGQLLPWQTKLNKNNLEGIGPTVTNSAIKLAMDMGVKQQILFGVDLCYSTEGYTHAKGSKEHDIGPKVNALGQSIITNKGKQAETNSAYYEAINVIELQAELIYSKGGEVLNPSENAAKMKYVDFCLLEKIIKPIKKISISEFLQKKKELNQNQNYKIYHNQSLLKELNSTLYKVKKIKSLAMKGLEYNDKLFIKNKAIPNQKIKNKILKIENQLNHENLIDYTSLSKNFYPDKFIEFTESNDQINISKIKEIGRSYYELLKEGAIELEKLIFTAINRIEIRLLENNNLIIDSALIKRHLCSFELTNTLDFKINRYKNLINESYNQWTKKQKEGSSKHLEKLLQRKQSTIDECKQIYLLFQQQDKTLGQNFKEIKHTISFYLTVLQNASSMQNRRIFITAKQNKLLLNHSTKVTILGRKISILIKDVLETNKFFLGQLFNSQLLKSTNQLTNLAENHTPSYILKNYFEGKSAILILDKSSLDEYKSWIEANQEFYIIVSLSHMVDALLETKIKPDIFIATIFDTTKFESNKSIIQFESTSLLVNHNSLSPNLLGNWLGMNLYTDTLFPWKSHLNIKNYKCIITDEVSNAISFSKYIGLNKQYLFLKNSDIVNNKNNLTKLIKKEGIELYIPFDSSHINSSFQEINFKKRINISREKINISYFLQQQSIKQEDKSKHYYQILDELKSIESKLNSALSNEDLINFTSLIKLFNKNELIPTSNITDEVYPFVKQILSSIIKIELRLYEQNSLTFIDSFIEKYLTNRRECLLDIVPESHREILEYKNLIKEYKSNYDKEYTIFLFSTLINGINSNYRRITFFEKNNNKLLKNSRARIINKIILDNKKKAKKLFEKQKNHNQNISNEGLEIKLYNLFVLKDKAALIRIIKGIKLQNNNLNRAFTHLAQGYLYELDNNSEHAINEYSQSDHEKTRESALKRIVSIFLDNADLENARHVLQLLTEISPDYLIQLGELYSLTKNYKDALDTYALYLDHYPSDVTILLKIGNLYEKQNIIDGAIFIYNEILKLEPGNKIATSSLELLAK